ncbi:MAG: alpha/beta hydrolase [Mycobacterium sp.]|uniref:alpha/beta hydrolase n=1 Tax=Mycobacterium sp. TaxID=1785 RepID=UPI000CB70EB5|nr:alpha/beta fold hydrolase [Mycobacterium sp.]MBX9980307.1 lysophospholipase [Mycobacterium gordonae]PJE06425.1 MAG: alpha/beta hydrolase [Mycobacterium sp.]PJE10868.1 MAG: alpha/beta hydrolase [Mycobacterium sp.]
MAAPARRCAPTPPADPRVLEVIAKGEPTEEHPVPLLFVHGAWHAAWCWDEHFLDFFAGHGFRVIAPSLRGHGASPGALRGAGIRDYVDDVASVAKSLPRPPVVIGHSMGGFVVQHYLQRHTAAAAILLASIRPKGVLRVTGRIARRHPVRFSRVNAERRLGPLVATPKLARELFFSPGMPAEEVHAYQRRLQDESYRAFLDMLALDLVDTRHVKRVPMLVLGAELDAIVTPRETRSIAAVYGTEAEVFPDLAHDMMLEPRWPAVAGRMLSWLTTQKL